MCNSCLCTHVYMFLSQCTDFVLKKIYPLYHSELFYLLMPLFHLKEFMDINLIHLNVSIMPFWKCVIKQIWVKSYYYVHVYGGAICRFIIHFPAWANSQGSCIEFGIFGLLNRQTVSTSGKSDNIIGVFLKFKSLSTLESTKANWLN